MEVIRKVRARLRVQEDGVRPTGELGVVHVDSRVDDGDRLAWPGRSELRGPDHPQPPLRAGQDGLFDSAGQHPHGPIGLDPASEATTRERRQHSPGDRRRQRPDPEIVLDERCAGSAQRSGHSGIGRPLELDEHTGRLVRSCARRREESRPRRRRRARGRDEREDHDEQDDAAAEGLPFQTAASGRGSWFPARRVLGLTSRSSSSRSRRRPRARARTRAVPWPSPGGRCPSSRRL